MLMNRKFPGLIRLKKSSVIPGLYDAEIEGVKNLGKFSSTEFHFVIYPYSRKISAEEFTINPFEEYILDLSKNQKSAYLKIQSKAKEIFGLMLGALLLIFFMLIRPDKLVSVEAIVSIFAAYFIGKDLWIDIEDLFIRLTGKWKIRYQRDYYDYKLDKNSTLANYSEFAKKQRYGKGALIPSKMDFIEQRNSATVRLYFDKSDLEKAENNMHLFAIRVKPESVNDFEKRGYLFGSKVSLNKKFLFIESGLDLFQSVSKDKQGCLGDGGNWMEDTLYYRKTLRIGRIRFYYKTGYSQGRIVSKE
jgi:hypothetical protein